ncbi:hypothetical protein EMIT0158MI4_100229 [Burkholderia ambifaria]
MRARCGSSERRSPLLLFPFFFRPRRHKKRALHDAALFGFPADSVSRYCAAGLLAGSVGIAGAIGAPLAAGAVVAPADAATGAAAGALAGVAPSAPGSSYCGNPGAAGALFGAAPDAPPASPGSS